MQGSYVVRATFPDGTRLHRCLAPGDADRGVREDPEYVAALRADLTAEANEKRKRGPA